jgi:YHS domain-containing protein
MAMNQGDRKTRSLQRKKDSLRDPVCGMMVDASENAIVYQQMHFAFCSLQCKERFLQTPHLYIGQGGHKAPKQEGQAVYKQRLLKLDKSLTPEMAETVLDNVQAMMGIEQLEINGDVIKVTYDLLQATEAQIESEIAQAGASLGQKWSERLRRAFVHYVEESEIENLAVLPPAQGHHH